MGFSAILPAELIIECTKNEKKPGHKKQQAKSKKDNNNNYQCNCRQIGYSDGKAIVPRTTTSSNTIAPQNNHNQFNRWR